MGNGIFTEVYTAGFLNFLHLERHEHRKALRNKRAECVYLSRAYGQNGIKTVNLLIAQSCHLAHMLARN